MQNFRNTVPLVDDSAKGIPEKFVQVQITWESRVWYLLHAICIKEFPLCSCLKSSIVVVSQLKLVHIQSCCLWEPMALQKTPVEEGVVVSIRVLPMAFAYTLTVGPYHP